MEKDIKDKIKELCLEFQLGFIQPKNAQDCVELANAILHTSMNTFVVNDSFIQTSIGVVTSKGLRMNLHYTQEEENVEEEEEV